MEKPALGTVATVAGIVGVLVGLVAFIGGFFSGYMAFRADTAGNKENVAGLLDHVDKISTRLTVVEQDIKHIDQGIAELKIATVPRR